MAAAGGTEPDRGATVALGVSTAAAGEDAHVSRVLSLIGPPPPLPKPARAMRALTIDDRLLFAAASGKVPDIEACLAEGAAVNFQRDDGVSSLHAGAWSADAVRVLLRAGANPNIRNTSGDTPLIVAASKRSADVVRMLIDHGADITCRRKNNSTALHVACAAAAPSIVRALVERGADVNALNEANDTPLIVAAATNSFECVCALLESGRDVLVNAQRENGATALHFACTRGNASAAARLLDAGATVDATNHAGDTSLILAADNGAETVVDLLLRRGADVSRCRHSNGATALHVAAGRGFTSIIGQLLAAGLDPNVQNKERETPLLVSLARCKLEATDMLLRAGASVEVVSVHGVTPYDVGLRDPRCWRLLLSSSDSIGFLVGHTASFQRIVSVLFDNARHGRTDELFLFLAFAGSAKRLIRSYLAWLIDSHRAKLTRGFSDDIAQVIMAFIADPAAAAEDLQRRFR